jgi:hypothetical protein
MASIAALVAEMDADAATVFDTEAATEAVSDTVAGLEGETVDVGVTLGIKPPLRVTDGELKTLGVMEGDTVLEGSVCTAYSFPSLAVTYSVRLGPSAALPLMAELPDPTVPCAIKVPERGLKAPTQPFELPTYAMPSPEIMTLALSAEPTGSVYVTAPVPAFRP